MGLLSLSGLVEKWDMNQSSTTDVANFGHPMDCEVRDGAGKKAATAGVKQREILFSTDTQSEYLQAGF
jgi:hypothetical protein